MTPLVRLVEWAARRDGRTGRGGDRGSAVVEFFWLGVLLLVPLTYAVITAASVQRGAFAVTQAAQQAARAYATARSDAVGRARAQAVAALAMADQGVQWSPEQAVISCGGCSYAPGSTFTAAVTARVPLPLVPSFLCGRHCVAAISVAAHHTQRLGCYIGTGALVGGAC